MNNKFFKSDMVNISELNTIDFVIKWINKKKADAKFNIDKISLEKLIHWNTDKNSGNYLSSF